MASDRDNLPVRYEVRDLEIMAKKVAQSRLFGLDEAQAFTLMLLAEAENLHPIQAVRRYHVIDGRPAMRADTMQAEFQRHGGKVRWVESTPEVCEVEFSHPTLHPEPRIIRVTYAELDKAGITRGKEGLKKNWRQHPAAMLRARAISSGVRMIDPGIVVGIYTPEEIADIEPARKAPQTTARPSDAPAPTRANGDGDGDGGGWDRPAAPDRVGSYLVALDAYLDRRNREWLDGWKGEDGRLPEGVEKLYDRWPADNHMLNWCVETGRLRLPPEEVARAKREHRIGIYTAVVYHRSGEDRGHFARELRRRVDERAEEQRTRIEDLNPDLFDDDPDDADFAAAGAHADAPGIERTSPEPDDRADADEDQGEEMDWEPGVKG